MKGEKLTVISVVIESDTPPNKLHKGMQMLLATASISAISTAALTFSQRYNYIISLIKTTPIAEMEKHSVRETYSEKRKERPKDKGLNVNNCWEIQ